MHGRSGLVIEGYETAGEAAERLGITQKYVVRLAAAGMIPGAQQVNAGRRYWYVPKDCDPLFRVPEGYELTDAAALRLGMSHSRLTHILAAGKMPGARRVQAGTRWVWLVPREGAVPTAARIGGWRACSRPTLRMPRCECCGIILERSGDEKHANDKPDAARCWMCREDYGAGGDAARWWTNEAAEASET